MPKDPDPAHLFMRLYDELPEDLFLGGEPSRWRADKQVRDAAEAVTGAVLPDGVADHRELVRLVGGEDRRALFAILLGLDSALQHANPFAGGYEQFGMVGIAARYAATGMFNDPAVMPGALLPRGAMRAGPAGRGHKEDFFGVHRVSAETWDKDLVRYRVLEPRHEPGFLPGEPVKVACAPVLASYQEMGLTLEDRTPTMVYRLGPALLDDATARITRIIDRMDAAGARIGVLPEGCLSPELLDEWRRIARETAAPDKPLRWLLLGSGPVSDADPPHNRAVLVDRWTGTILLTHDKLERFSVTHEQVRDWHLPWPLPDGPVEEGITRGGTIEVLETRLGRLAVLICEDLNESAGWEREVAAFGVSHLFVPIFAKPILPFRWEYQTAERQVRRLGAWVVISNSLAVAAALGAAGDGYTCLVMGPAETKRRTRYAVATQFGRAGDAADLGWVARPGGPDLPEILPAVMYPEWFGG